MGRPTGKTLPGPGSITIKPNQCQSKPFNSAWARLKGQLIDVLVGYIRVNYDVFFQRFNLRHLPPLHQMHGSAEGLTCIVTGPTSGIGREVARTLALRGAHVILACRSEQRGKAVKQLIEDAVRKDPANKSKLEVEILDVACLESVRRFVERWRKRKAPIHVLVNNAGIFAMGAGREETEDGFEAHMGTNHLGPFLLTCLLLPSLREARKDGRRGRVVSVSSMMHYCTPGINEGNPMLDGKGSFSPVRAYCNSKLAQIQFTAELRRRLAAGSGGKDGSGTPDVEAYAVHPGEVLTDVVRSLPPLMQRAYQTLLRYILLTPAEGARPVIECALAMCPGGPSGPSHGPSTCYISSDCRIEAPSRAATDPDKGSWLWSWSAEKTGLPNQYNLAPPRSPTGGPQEKKQT